MVLETVEHSAISSQNPAQIQRLAWMIVVVSFIMFCSISIAVTGSIYYFFFRSAVPLDVVLQVARGSAGLEVLDQNRFISSESEPISLTDRPSQVTTDSQSQLTLSFQIPNEDSSIVLGTLTLENSSAISLEDARRPRFTWSEGIYTLEFDDFVGEADVFIPRAVNREFELRVNTANNATFLIDQAGRYTLIVNEVSITLITIEGEAFLLSPNRNNNRLAVAGQQAILRTGGGIPVVQDAPINLLRNGLFAFDIPVDSNFAPQPWVCFARSDASPSGQYRADQWQERAALRLIRTNADSSSQTGCYQSLEVEVSDNSYLELRATFAINYQSLQNCGVRGSECPMMLFINFTDRDGNTGVWYQGLFYNFVPQSPTNPLVCLDCGGGYEHRPISEQVWYTYESGNLMNRFLAEQQPAVINEIRFYASGHEYDVFVSEVALYAGREQVVPINPQGN